MINANDILNVQECLTSYKILLDWIPAITKEDRDLKYIRIQTINHLIGKCDDVLEELKNE